MYTSSYSSFSTLRMIKQVIDPGMFKLCYKVNKCTRLVSIESNLNTNYAMAHVYLSIVKYHQLYVPYCWSTFLSICTV